MHLGCNIYFWGEREQDRLLALAVKPLADVEGLRFLCFRFDARGPHVTLLFRAIPGADGEAKARIAAAIEGYLSHAPSAAWPSAGELEARHTTCRGKALCSADREPGLAPNNSLVFFGHTERDYPFHLATDVAELDRDALWRLREEVVLWALGQLAASARGQVTAAAVRWIAAIDRAVRAAGEPSSPCWRYMAAQVLLGLSSGVEEPTTAKLFSSVGEKNCQALSRLWRESESSANDDLQRLVRVIVADDGRPLERRHALLRDLVHTTLLLLGLQVQQQAPLLLFAWAKSRALEEGS